MSETSPLKKIVKIEKEETSIDALYVEELVEIVFSYLNYDTLCVAQHVCRLWQKKAHEKLLKNYPPFCTNLPNVFIREGNDNLFANDHPTIRDIVKTVPEKVAILICPYIMGERDIENYLQILPHDSTAVNEFTYVDDVNLDTTRNLMAVMFFPKIPSIKIRPYTVIEAKTYKFINIPSALTELFDLDSKEKGNCLIILGTNLSYNTGEPEPEEKKFISEILDYLKNVNNTHKLTIWGGTCTVLYHRDIHLNIESINWHILNIIGINSYSIVLNFDLNKESFKKKLEDFKNTIILKKESFALAIAHTKHLNSEPREQIMEKVLWFKDIFNIKLTTIISHFDENVHCDPIIFCNASDNENLKIENKNLNTVAYLIISN